MATVAMSGNDTFTLNDRILTDFADGDCVALTFPNEIANVTTGKNGNSIYGQNATGRQCEVVMRLVRGSGDDKYLNSQMALQNNSFETFILMTGQFIKKIGNGQGAVLSDTYVLSGGIFTAGVEGKNNVNGETDQSISEYKMKFSLAPRALG